jgi:hypothetical protein
MTGISKAFSLIDSIIELILTITGLLTGNSTICGT